MTLALTEKVAGCGQTLALWQTLRTKDSLSIARLCESSLYPAEQESRTLARPRDDKDPIFAFIKLNASRDGPFSSNFFQACRSPRRAMHRICLPGVPRETCATRAGSACRDRTWVHASHVTRIDDALDGDRSRRAHAARSVAAPPIGRAQPEFDELFVSKTGQTVRSYLRTSPSATSCHTVR